MYFSKVPIYIDTYMLYITSFIYIYILFMNSNNFINIYQTVQMVEPLNNIIHVQNYISDIILYRNVLMYALVI